MSKLLSLSSFLLLTVLAASMVVLPLILPPLPPPPLMLLFFPVGIMAALMILAFSPSHDPNLLIFSL
uniref:Transmembrane protein n=1 Tax=Cannabis sativa TaxID=3483 RepID=A0A803RCN6_CANSA